MFKLQFHNINEFGYYEKQPKKDDDNISYKHVHGSILDVLTSLENWTRSNNLTIENTTTFEDDDYAYNGVKNVYCHSIKKAKDSNDFLLITWNETFNNESAIATLTRNSKVGEGAVESLKIGENQIPGFPSFFWFLPDSNLFATLKLNNESTATPQMRDYVKCFMKYVNPNYVQKAETDDPEKFTIIYDNNPTAKRLIRFNSNLLMNKASLKFVKENFDKIQYVCGKNTLVKTVNYDMDILEKIAVKIGFADLKIPQKSTFKFEIQYDLDEESVEQIFHNYSHNLTEKIGFYINGKSYWMSKMTSRCEVSSNGIMKNSFMPDEEKLLLLLTSQKDDIFLKANVEPV